MSPFRLRPRVDPDLPRLAWCARVRARSNEVVVCHGADVEADQHTLFEGAWDGDFADLAFDRATFFAGTGVAVQGDRLRFVAGTARENRIYAARRGEDLWVSNSLTFTLVATRDAPDPKTRDYAGEIRRQIGSERFDYTPYTMGFRHGSVDVFEMRDLEVDAALAMTSIPKVAIPTPEGFDDVVAQLDGITRRTFANAVDGARRRRKYQPLATVSRGFDSPAMAVLAARHGCREAITMSETMPGVARPEDDGTPIAERLGMSVLHRARDTWRMRTDLPEAESCATPPAKSLGRSSIQDDLAGRLLTSGQYGGWVFAKVKLSGKECANIWSAAGSVAEMRLRVGYIDCSPFHVLRPHIDAMISLSNGDELAPYRTRASYDRPIPRRILLEAGVDGALFGQRKVAGWVSDVRWEDQLSPISRPDFAEFVASTRDLPSVVDLPLRRAVNTNLRRVRKLVNRGLRGVNLPSLPSVRGWGLIDDPRLFHWGFARIRPRYQGRAP